MNNEEKVEVHKQYKRDYYQRNKRALCAKKREQYENFKFKQKESQPKGGIQISRGSFIISFQ